MLVCVGGLWFCYTQMFCANVTYGENGDIAGHKLSESWAVS